MPQLHADPYAWLLTMPMTLILFLCYIQPADSPLRQAWEQLMRMQANGWASLTGRPWARSPLNWLQRAAYWAIVTVLLVATAVSLSAFVMKP